MPRLVAVAETGHRIGEDHANARYTDGEVEQVRQLRETGFGYKRIARIMEMPVRTVRDLVNYKRRACTPAAWRYPSAPKH